MHSLTSSKRVPYHVISTLKDINNKFPLSHWNPHQLLKNLQEAVLLKHKIETPSASILFNLSSLKTDPKTKKAILDTALKLIFKHPLHADVNLHDANQLKFLSHKPVSKELGNAKPQWQAHILTDIQLFFKHPKLY